MTPDPDPELSPGQQSADPEWFRQPTPREHRIASMLFGGFGLFFITFSFVLVGIWFRWVFLFLGIFSVIRAVWHLIISRRPGGT